MVEHAISEEECWALKHVCVRMNTFARGGGGVKVEHFEWCKRARYHNI